MINLKTGLNELSRTLKDRILLDAPFFLIEFTWVSDRDNPKVVLVNDISLPGAKNNKLELTVTNTEGDEDLGAGIIYMNPNGGNYYYKIFESVDATLTLTGKNRLEQGLAKYEVDTVERRAYEKQTVTKRVYNG